MCKGVTTEREGKARERERFREWYREGKRDEKREREPKETYLRTMYHELPRQHQVRRACRTSPGVNDGPGLFRERSDARIGSVHHSW